MAMIEVSAGIVTRPDGRLLAAKRGEGRKNAHLWEFPGGKREPGETYEACLQRELLEELGLPVRDVKPVYSRDEQGIHFVFLTAVTEAEPVATEHEALGFFRPRQLLGLPFCPADTVVARMLALNDPPLAGFFWDLDGTLMDTYPMITDCLCGACLDLGLPPQEPAAVLALLKTELAYAVRVLCGRYGREPAELRAAYDRRAAAADLSLVRPVPGIPETLRALHAAGVHHYIVTHRDRAGVIAMLRGSGLEALFDGMVTSDDGFPRKPAPDSCLHLLRTRGIDPQAAVMIGDRPLDMQAGRAAGMLTCLLDTEGRFPDTPCDLRAASALSLAELLHPGCLPGT